VEFSRKDTEAFSMVCVFSGVFLLNSKWGIVPPRHSMLTQPLKKSKESEIKK
jgi:hypothetical protein